MYNVIKQYIRSKNGDKKGLLIAFKDLNGKVRCGWSLKATGDKWDNELAHEIAVGRTTKVQFHNIHDIPPSLHSTYTYFLQRVVAYYKLGEAPKNNL